MDPAFDNVLEFRHGSWWNADTIAQLKERGISFCGISYPSLPDDVVKSSTTVYYRFHGVPQLYLSSYSETKLRMVAAKLRSFRNVKNVYCYFNNDIQVAAIDNALSLKNITDSFTAPVHSISSAAGNK